MSRIHAFASVAAVVLWAACGSGIAPDESDNRFVVLGPSLVELMFASDLGDRIVGIDRYSRWPEETDSLPEVGGYIDPSVEMIAALRPTSIHISGDSPRISELAADLGVPLYSYSFDSLAGIFEALDSLEARYGAGASSFRTDLRETLDSLKQAMSRVAPLSVMVVVYHDEGSSSLTVAGRSSFFADILEYVGCSVSAPSAGVWPRISAEGVISLAPDHIVCLYPGREDSLRVASMEDEFWQHLGFDSSRVHCLFQPYLMIPGGRLGLTAERICSCLD